MKQNLGDLLGIRIIFYDFDGVFTDNHVTIDSNGVEYVRCTRLDGFGISRLRSLGILQYIVSTEVDQVVSRRADKLQIPVCQGVVDKAAAIRRICSVEGIPLRFSAFVGNDINDIAAMQTAGLSFAVADALPVVLELANYVTIRNGGYGAVREICDLIADAVSASSRILD